MIRPFVAAVAALLAVAGRTSAGDGSAPFATATASPSAASRTTADPETGERPPAPVLDQPDAARAVQLAALLSRDIGPRPAGSTADGAARVVVGSWLRGAGWPVEEEPVDLPQGGTSANVVATWDGRGPGAPHVVLGAHLDTVGGSPGANDNATGIGVLVALAAELADEAADLPVPVVLVAFAAEEYQPGTRAHHIGSEAHAARHGDEVVAMLSIDMVGHGPRTCICWFDLGPGSLADRLAALAGDEGFRVERRGDISDHGPFARRGLPAALLWSYGDGRLHTPADTGEHLQVDAVARAARLSAAFVRSLGAEDAGGR